MYERRDSSGNAALTTIFTTMGPDDDTVTILDSSGWPTGGLNGDFFGIIEDEVIRFSARNGTLLTVAANGRGWDNTAASTHQAGMEISHVFTRTDGDEANYAVSETVGKVLAAEDILVGEGANRFKRVGTGGNGQLLQIVSGQVGWAALGSASVPNDTITADMIADGAIDSVDKFVAGAVDNNAIATDAVGVNEIAADSVSHDKMQNNSVGTAELIDNNVTFGKLEQSQRCDPGDLKFSARSSATSGWLLCDGSAVDRTTYADLFSAIGTEYGTGDGSTTFNVPDYRGRTILGAGTGSGLTARARGATGGTETHLLVTSEMPSHTHIQNSHNHTQSPHGHDIHTSYNDLASGIARVYGVGYQALGRDSNNTLDIIDETAVNIAATAVNQNEGGGGTHNNMPPFGVANVFIKT